MSNASPQFQQLAMWATPDELKSMYAHDFSYDARTDAKSRNVRIGDITDDMRDAREHDGSATGYRGAANARQYIERMKTRFNALGEVDAPIHVWHAPNDPKDPAASKAPWVMDGHHRAQAAIETGRVVPLVHHLETDRHQAMDSSFFGPDSEFGTFEAGKR